MNWSPTGRFFEVKPDGTLIAGSPQKLPMPPRGSENERSVSRFVSIGVAATGFIVQATGSYSCVFYLAAAVYLVGLVAYDVWGSGERKL